jgi:hypothetical protein
LGAAQVEIQLFLEHLEGLAVAVDQAIQVLGLELQDKDMLVVLVMHLQYLEAVAEEVQVLLVLLVLALLMEVMG